jgi:hypothetical protein
MSARQLIIKLVRTEYEKASNGYREAQATRAGVEAAAQTWERLNSDCPGVWRNPHNATEASNREQKAKDHYLEMKSAYECAVDTFVSIEP